MTKYNAKIAAIEGKIAAEQQRLRNLRARETAQQRRDDTRRKILYGAAVLSLLERLSLDNRRETLVRLHKHIRARKDREFLGLPPLLDPGNKDGQHTGNASSGK